MKVTPADLSAAGQPVFTGHHHMEPVIVQRLEDRVVAVVQRPPAGFSTGGR